MASSCSCSEVMMMDKDSVKAFSLMVGSGVACGLMLWLALGIAAHGFDASALDMGSLFGSLLMGGISGWIMYLM